MTKEWQKKSTTPAYLLAVVSLLSGCAVTTERFAPEYSRGYVLTSDTKVNTDCGMWTGFYSLNIGGPETVNCVVVEGYDNMPHSPEIIERDKKRMVLLKKGSPVHIKRIFTVVHEDQTNAELEITDLSTGVTTPVYVRHWPHWNPHLLDSK